MKKLWYYQKGYRYSEIKACLVEEYPKCYKVIGWEFDNGFLPVNVVKKSNMNTYDYYFFTSYDEAVKGIIKAMKETIDINIRNIKDACSEIDYCVGRINKYEKDNECL